MNQYWSFFRQNWKWIKSKEEEEEEVEIKKKTCYRKFILKQMQFSFYFEMLFLSFHLFLKLNAKHFRSVGIFKDKTQNFHVHSSIIPSHFVI